MDITFDSNTEGKNTVGEPWASADGKIGISTKLDKFLNLLRQHVSSSSNNSENTSLCLSVSYVHEKPDLIVGCRTRQTCGFLVVYASARMHHFSRNTLYLNYRTFWEID